MPFTALWCNLYSSFVQRAFGRRFAKVLQVPLDLSAFVSALMETGIYVVIRIFDETFKKRLHCDRRVLIYRRTTAPEPFILIDVSKTKVVG